MSTVDMHRRGMHSSRAWASCLARSAALIVATVAWLLFLEPLAAAEPAAVPLPGKTDGWTQVITAGFTDSGNTYIGSSAEYKGYLFISTIAGKTGEPYSGSEKEGADILRTKDGVTWEQIGEPGLGHPHNSTLRFVVFKDKLYAISDNNHDGLEIWVTSDGSEFTQIDEGGLGDKANTTAATFLFQDRMILGIRNSATGAQIWVSEDGEDFRQVVSGGLGSKNNSGIGNMSVSADSALVFRGMLYLGAVNLAEGGEIWRSADGEEWERVADNGLERSANVLMLPCLVFQDRLYAVGLASQGAGVGGLEVYRTSDGTTWEKVGGEDLDAGEGRNMVGLLTEFKGELYLSGSNYDPRILNPEQPSERLPPQGFRLYRSPDGDQWTQVGADGFGVNSSYTAFMDLHGEDAYIAVYDYHGGEQLWRSTDGDNWVLMFREPVPSWFAMGGGSLEFQGHLFWCDNDLKRGLEVWRTDEVVVAGGETTTGDAQGGGEGSASSGGLSGGILALIIVLAVVAVAAVGVAVRLRGTSRGRASAGVKPPAGPPPAGLEFCSGCGTAVGPDSAYCAGCGRKL